MLIIDLTVAFAFRLWFSFPNCPAFIAIEVLLELGFAFPYSWALTMVIAFPLACVERIIPEVVRILFVCTLALAFELGRELAFPNC